MRILIDMMGAQTHGSRVRGIGRYTRELALAMARMRGEDHITFALSLNFPDAAQDLQTMLSPLASADAFGFYQTPLRDRTSVPRTSAARRIGEAIVRRHVAMRAPDVVLATSLFESHREDFVFSDLSELGVPLTTCIVYDFIPEIFDKSYLNNSANRQFYDEQIVAMRSADLLLAISECTRDDAIRLHNIDPARIVNISAAADSHFLPVIVSDAERHTRLSRLGIERPFVLCVSGADWRKNPEVAFEAFAMLDATVSDAYQLVMAVPFAPAARAALQKKAVQRGLNPGQLVLVDHLDDDDLAFLYTHCRVFIFPSLYEGFGLPLLEAMQCGAAVIAGNNSSLREIANRPDVLCDTAHAPNVAAALNRALTSADWQRDVRAWGPVRSRDFSWDRTACLALDAIHAAKIDTRKPKVWPASLRLAEGLETDVAHVLDDDRKPVLPTVELATSMLQSCPGLFDGSLKRLLIDVSNIVSTDPRTGIQRVVRNVVESLYRMHDLGNVVPVAVRLEGNALVSCESFVARLTGVAQSVADARIDIAAGDCLLMLDSSWHQFDAFGEVFATIHARGGTIVNCMYDLIPERLPGSCIGIIPGIFSRWLRQVALESNGIIAISKTVADEFSDYVTAANVPVRNGLQVGWFHCGADIEIAPVPTTVRPAVQSAFAERQSFLVVGTIEPRKGHGVALDAFGLLWAAGTDANLVLIGKPGWYVEAILDALRMHPELGHRLFWFNDANDSELAFAYAHCAALIYPSYAEGFGLPLAEAARVGKPSLCSDIPIFREIGGEGTAFFPVNDPAALAALVTDFTAGRVPTDPSTVVATTWDAAARRIVDVVMHDGWTHRLNAAPVKAGTPD